MKIEFDPGKDAINLSKHGVSLAFGRQVFLDRKHVILPSIRLIDGEERYKAVGLVDVRLWTAVHVNRTGAVRFLSVRKSNDGEARAYHRNSGGPG